MGAAVPGTYEDLADEYYDPTRHPTCANFDTASESVLRRWLRSHKRDEWLCEVGAGRSVVARLLADRGEPIDRLILVDSSPSMLAHSKAWWGRGARPVLGDAASLPFAPATIDTFVSSLGDPYNVAACWRELSRALRAGGEVLFTIPAYEWVVGAGVTTGAFYMAFSKVPSKGL